MNRSLATDNCYLVDIWKEFAPGCAFDGLPGEGALIDRLHDVDHRGRATIGQGSAIAYEPAAAALLPRRFGKRAVSVERPGANRLCGGIPANDLNPRKTVVTDGNLERPHQEVFVLRPI